MVARAAGRSGGSSLLTSRMPRLTIALVLPAAAEAGCAGRDGAAGRMRGLLAAAAWPLALVNDSAATEIDSLSLPGALASRMPRLFAASVWPAAAACS